MTDIKEFVKYVQPDVPGCPLPLIEREIREIIQQFCEDTWILQQTLAVGITSDDIDTSLNNQVSIDLTNIVGTAYRPIFLVELDIDWVPYEALEWRHEITHNALILNTRNKKFFYFSGNTTLVLYPISKVCSIRVTISYKPLKNTTSYDDLFYEDYVDTIAAGVRSRLFKMPGKAWTNPQAADLEWRNYQRGVNRASKNVRYGFRKKSMAVQPRTFGE